ncbi:MAG: hypothetical protein D3924_02435 [Candidatus Electrothrix sp. AR4]|nr:hypothetical protein [Candidatus Electrothrix sp. AR4]
MVYTLIAIENSSALRQLRGYFFNFEVNDDGRYLRYLAAAIGMLASHVNMEEVADHLVLLKNVQEASDEASLQLGYYYLAKGLDSDQHTEAINGFELARDEFQVSTSLGEGRLDAQLLSNCIELLLHFYHGKLSNVKELYQQFLNTASEYSALLGDQKKTDNLIGSRVEVTYRWMLFASRLSLLQKSFDDEVWLEASIVIEEQLFFIYSAQRSLFKHNNSGGIASIVQPIISGHLQENRFQLMATLKWLESRAEKDRDEKWEFHYIELKQKLEASIRRSSHEAAGATSTLVAGTLTEDTKKNEFGDEWLTQKFSDAIEAFRCQQPAPAVAVLKQRLLSFLKSCNEEDDLIQHEDARNLFLFLVDRIFSFLIARKHVPKSKVNSLGYLLADFKDKVKEEHLQDDLHDFLRTGVFSTSITYEPQKHAGGRVDILVNYINVKTVIELKKIDKQMTDKRILDKYGPQATTYQVADTNFCFLGVLDNFVTGGEQLDLRESFSCHHWVPNTGTTRYSVMIFRVQGKRRSPSDLSKRPKQTI